ncbi:MAG: hypothetical protein RMK80_06405, partial [Pseudobdellovibrionaceae bacterium]|nr:hypothetical protein [Pseudobdellovibrionaceae bacterium]
MHIPTKKLLTMILLATFLVVPFQNCGNQFVLREENGLHLMSKGCDAEIFSIFENGFYPFLRQNCSKCHIDGGGGTGFFASPSVIEAWKYFYSDVSKIARNAVNDEHNPPYTGSKHQAVINQLLSSWNKAYQTKKECEIASNPNLDPLQRPFKLVDKQITAMPNSNTFTRISWSLYDEAARDDQKNLVPVTFDIEYRVVTPANQPTRLEFQNPRITVHAGEVELTDLRLLLNGMVLTDVTR